MQKRQWNTGRETSRLREGEHVLLCLCMIGSDTVGRLDSAFIEWKKELCDALLEEFPLASDEEKIPEETPLPPKWHLQFDEEDAQPYPVDGTILRPNSVTASVVENKRVTPSNHWQDVREISLDLSPPSEYSPGDTVSIMPPNPSDAVKTFLSLQDWPEKDLDRKLRLSPTQYIRGLYPDSVPPMPPITLVEPLTLRNIVKHHLDLISIPRRSFFSYMQPLTDDKIHNERIAEFADPNNLDDLWDYTIRPKRTLIEVLQEFNSVKIDYQTILNGGFPLIHPRLFSVASSATEIPSKDLEPTSSLKSTNVKLIVAILSYKTIIAKPRRGLSTTYLAQLQPPSSLSIIISSPPTRFSPPDSVPAIMIAAGTGIAPMRSLILDRSSRKVGITDDILFYGGRGPNVDYYFHEDWKRLELRVYAAWSRVEGQKRRYVQEEVVSRREEVKERLARGGWVLVCGKRGAFVKGVEEAFDLILKETGGSWAKLEAEGRIRIEAW